MTAPIASGWSDCRMGLAPIGKRRLFTAHTRSGHSPFGSLDPPRSLRPQSHAINALNSRIIVLRSEWRLK
jgi:hypothetical protein